MAHMGATNNNQSGLILLELTTHALSGGLLCLMLVNFVSSEELIKIAAVLTVFTLLRIASTFSFKSHTTSSTSSMMSDSFGYRPKSNQVLSVLGLGLAWAGISILLDNLSDLPVGAFYVMPVLTVGAALAIYTGSALNTQLLLWFGFCAYAPPAYWFIYKNQYEIAAVWLFLLFVLTILSRASKHVDELLMRFQRLYGGSTKLVADLSEARNKAVQSQHLAQRAREEMQAEVKERKRAEERIKASEIELSRILEDMMDTCFQIDIDGSIIRMSHSAEKLLGYNREEIMARNWSDFFPSQEGYEKFIAAADSSFGTLLNHEICLQHKDGQDVWVTLNAHYRYNEHGRPEGIEGVARDTTESRLAREILFKEKELWKITLDSIADGVITTDLEGSVIYLNSVAETKTGWSKEKANNQPLEDVLKLVNEKDDAPIKLPVSTWLKDGIKASLEEPADLQTRNNEERCSIELTGAPIRDSKSQIIGSVTVFHDVTKLRALTTQLSYQATHDALTGLINRVAFDAHLEQAIHSAGRSEKTHALFYMDLDQFKIVNDTCGHAAGDELLIQITSLIRDTLRESDLLARLGGDEFGVLLTGCSLSKAEEIAESLRKLVEDYRFPWEDRVFRIGASIGVVPITDSETSLTELLKAVDTACYVAKENGRNQVHVSLPDDTAAAAHHGQMQWMQRIQHAIENDEFVLYGQPIFDISGNAYKCHHVEILLRLVEAKGTDVERIIPPNAFIPAAERYHIMPAVDRWVIRKALSWLSESESSARSDLIYTINLSGQSLSDTGMFDYISKQIKATGVNPKRICFEITESAVIANMNVAQQFVKDLRALGCLMALDDFGAGLSTFEYLKQLPVDFVKLDGSMIRDVASSRISQAMVHAVNYVAHEMGMKSVAEYAESDEIIAALKKLSIDYAQGHALGKPEPLYDTVPSKLLLEEGA